MIYIILAIIVFVMLLVFVPVVFLIIKSKAKNNIIVDEQAINRGDVQEIIAPLWHSVSIYDDVEKYEEALKPYTTQQRYIFAIEWYLAEVGNGGHGQFYTNSTGIVWEDSLNGLKEIGADKHFEILKESVDRMGGSPSKDREEREAEFDKISPDFEDLDMRLFETDGELVEKMLKYIRANKDSFYFNNS